MTDDRISASTSSSKTKRHFSFRSKNSSRRGSEGANTNVNDSEKKKKKRSKSFRSIRGFLSGESRRERRAKRRAEKEAARAKGLDVDSVEEEEETQYGVNLDASPIGDALVTPKALLQLRETDKEEEEEEDGNFMSPAAAAPAVEDAVRVILLLLDPKSRRFELLQLEFASNRALVSDVIAQIPLSVTEEPLRSLIFTGVCDRGGMELIKTCRLAEFVSGNDLLVAIPSGMKASECAKLAAPILSNEGVANMLQENGIEVVAQTPKSRFAAAKELPADPVKVSKDPTLRQSMVKSISLASLICLLAMLLQGIHSMISAPLAPGHSMAPGTWRSKCGILSPFPSLCENAVLSMGRDGVLSLTGPDKESVEWKIVGGVCKPDSNCTDGVAVKENGRIEIAGISVTSVTVLGDAPLSPWPFAQDPRLRVVRPNN